MTQSPTSHIESGAWRERIGWGNRTVRSGRLEWRRGSESNRRPRLCRPLHDHSATPPLLRNQNRLHDNVIDNQKGKMDFGKGSHLFIHGLLLKNPFSLQTGAGNETRTRDPNLGKVVLYH